MAVPKSPYYFLRSLEPFLEKATIERPAIVLTGPRQAGKTTLLKQLFASSHQYVSLELPEIRQFALSDPSGFMSKYRPPVMVDEVQYAPDLLSYVKEEIDADRDAYGRYILTGSQNLLVSERVTQSLAGRAQILDLLSLSRREAEGRPQLALPWEPGRDSSADCSLKQSTWPPSDGEALQLPFDDKPQGYKDFWKALLRGTYPELVRNPTFDAWTWHSAFLRTYLERDVRTVKRVGDLDQFQLFVRILAASSAQQLNLSRLATELGVAVNTVKTWLAVLQATYQVVVVRPYSGNFRKRLVKTPKIYFTDVGMLCYLLGIRDPVSACEGPWAGALMETAVFCEIYKALVHRAEYPQIFFWRTSTGEEVDFVVRTGQGLVPIEVKASLKPSRSAAAGIVRLRDGLQDAVLPGYVVYPGDSREELRPGVTALPFTDL